MDFAWKAIIMVVVGTVLLRLSGRKSIARTSITQTVIIISIGSIIVEPLVETSVWKTAISAAIFVAFLLLVEWLKMKFDSIERIFSGVAVPVIREGEPIIKNLRKLRLSIDQLESQLRQQGIRDIGAIKYATLESNGELGYELKRDARPVTIGELETILASMSKDDRQKIDQKKEASNLFHEAMAKGHREEPPKHLQ